MAGEVKSGVNLHEATWLPWSPNVFIERSADHVGAPPPLDDNQATTEWISRFD